MGEFLPDGEGSFWIGIAFGCSVRTVYLYTLHGEGMAAVGRRHWCGRRRHGVTEYREGMSWDFPVVLLINDPLADAALSRSLIDQYSTVSHIMRERRGGPFASA